MPARFQKSGHVFESNVLLQLKISPGRNDFSGGRLGQGGHMMQS
jgi:hypothetical protein